jgi:hypothetical protein
VTWSKDGWTCQVCQQRTYSSGPWCDLYVVERRKMCPPVIAEIIRAADAIGDGPKVNAMCEYARKLYGEGLYW